MASAMARGFPAPTHILPVDPPFLTGQPSHFPLANLEISHRKMLKECFDQILPLPEGCTGKVKLNGMPFFRSYIHPMVW